MSHTRALFAALTLLACSVAGAQDSTVRRPSPITTRITSVVILVPNVVDSSLAVAQVLLARYRLRVGRIDTVAARAAPGIVVRQAPAAGSPIPGDRVVQLVISKPASGGTQDGPPPIVAPDLVGRTVPAALELLRSRKLALARVDSASANAPRGTIVRQLPSAGSNVQSGTAFSVWVARGPAAVDSVVVPEVRGVALADALRQLQRSGLSIGRVDSLRSRLAAGLIAQQRPAPGTVVARNSAVDVWTSGFAPPPVRVDSIAVPDVRERAIADAATLLRESRLALGRIDSAPSASTPGRVMRQVPAPGSRVPIATPIDVVIAHAVPVPTTIVPVIEGRSLEQADELLRAARLRAGRIDSVTSEARSGTVARQSQPAGTVLPLDAAVDFSIARGRPRPAPPPSPPPTSPSRANRPPDAQATRAATDTARSATTARRTVPVPALTGLRLDSARRVLALVGLRNTVSVAVADSVAARVTVVDQDPRPNTPALPGSVVRLTPAQPTSPASSGRMIRMPLWVPTLGGLLALLLAAGVHLARARRRPRNERSATPPRVRMAARADAGTHRVVAGGDHLMGDSEVRLLAHATPGLATITADAPLIGEE